MSRVCGLTLLVALAAGLALSGGRSAAQAAGAAGPRILYASDWSGTFQVYAVDPSGRSPYGQLTSGRAPACEPGDPCGFVKPLASPDGTKVLFWDDVAGGLWYVRLFVARADGSGRRQLLKVNNFAPPPTSWSPDSRRVAYADADGVEVVSAAGGRSRLVARARGLLFGDVSWSPAGTWIAYRSDGIRLVSPDGRRGRSVADAQGSFGWSPDGRQLAFAADGIQLYDARTGTIRRLTAQTATNLAWSPDGRVIAFVSGKSIGLVGVESGVVQPLDQDVVAGSTPLTWSPDSRLLAYVRYADRPLGLGSYDLRVVDRTGKVRTAVSRASDFGGLITGAAWTRPPAGVHYPRPSGRTLAVASQRDLTAPFPIQRLAADGSRVAYTSCGHAFVWTPKSGRVEQAEDQSSFSPRCYDNRGIVTLGLAGDRVATGWVGGGNTTYWWLGGTTLLPLRPGFELGAGSATMGLVKNGFLGDLVGAGSLLVFSSRDDASGGGVCCTAVTTRQRIVRAESGGCPCPVIASEPGPFVPNDVDDDRIAAVGDNAVVLLDRDGTRLLTVDVKARAAQLSGRDLVALTSTRLVQFDAATGNELHTWPATGSPSLQDVARGLVAYVLDRQVHLLRLADGRDVVFAPGTLARFMDDGLVYTDGAKLRLVPFERLPF